MRWSEEDRGQTKIEDREHSSLLQRGLENGDREHSSLLPKRYSVISVSKIASTARSYQRSLEVYRASKEDREHSSLLPKKS